MDRAIASRTWTLTMGVEVHMHLVSESTWTNILSQYPIQLLLVLSQLPGHGRCPMDTWTKTVFIDRSIAPLIIAQLVAGIHEQGDEETYNLLQLFLHFILPHLKAKEEHLHHLANSAIYLPSSQLP